MQLVSFATSWWELPSIAPPPSQAWAWSFIDPWSISLTYNCTDGKRLAIDFL